MIMKPQELTRKQNMELELKLTRLKGVETWFELLERYERRWGYGRGSKPLCILQFKTLVAYGATKTFVLLYNEKKKKNSH
jgi:hypothetical protein